jgi:hypothetical protein
LQLAKNTEWDARATSIHCEQEPAHGSRVELLPPLEEVDAISILLAKRRQQHGDLLASPLEALQAL